VSDAEARAMRDTGALPDAWRQPRPGSNGPADTGPDTDACARLDGNAHSGANAHANAWAHGYADPDT
jgi:hypothetical protein